MAGTSPARRDAKGRLLKGTAPLNPHGRPIGRSYANRIRAYLGEGLEEVINSLRHKATALNDTQAQRILLAYVLPTLRPEALSIELPALKAATSLSQKAHAVLDAIADGAVDAATGRELLDALTMTVRLEESTELKARIEALEAASLV